MCDAPSKSFAPPPPPFENPWSAPEHTLEQYDWITRRDYTETADDTWLYILPPRGKMFLKWNIRTNLGSKAEWFIAHLDTVQVKWFVSRVHSNSLGMFARNRSRFKLKFSEASTTLNYQPLTMACVHTVTKQRVFEVKKKKKKQAEVLS